MRQSEWTVASFGSCADFQEGYVNPAQSVTAYFDGPISWLRAVDLNDGFVNETSRTLSVEGFKSAGKAATLFPAGTLAISKSGTIGRIGILQREMCGNRAVINVRPRPDRLDVRFAFYSMLLGRPQIERLAEGSVQKNLYVSALSKFSLFLPPLPEQRAIGATLGALDDKIELNRKMNATLEAMARALFRDWFVDFGPTRAKAEGRAPYLSPELWPLFPDRLDAEGKPEGWKIGTLGAVATARNEGVDPSAISPDTPYIGLEHMPRGSIALSDWEGAGKVSSNKAAFVAGDFLFGKLRPYFHKVGIAPVTGICSTDIVVVRPKSPAWGGFVIACISDEDFVAYTDKTSTGTKMPRTSWGVMAMYPVAPVSFTHL